MLQPNMMTQRKFGAQAHTMLTRADDIRSLMASGLVLLFVLVLLGLLINGGSGAP